MEPLPIWQPTDTIYKDPRSVFHKCAGQSSNAMGTLVATFYIFPVALCTLTKNGLHSAYHNSYVPFVCVTARVNWHPFIKNTDGYYLSTVPPTQMCYSKSPCKNFQISNLLTYIMSMCLWNIFFTVVYISIVYPVLVLVSSIERISTASSHPTLGLEIYPSMKLLP